MRLRIAVVCATLTVLGLAATGSASSRQGSQPAMRIKALDGSLVRVGSMGAFTLYAVRLRAILCFPSARTALTTYPSEIRVTHFAVSRSRSRWWVARTSIDRAPWLVPFGETWQGKACGQVRVEDAIPPQHYGVESLGDSRGCYGVGLTIRAGRSQASRRTVVACGRRFG